MIWAFDHIDAAQIKMCWQCWQTHWLPLGLRLSLWWGERSGASCSTWNLDESLLQGGVCNPPVAEATASEVRPRTDQMSTEGPVRDNESRAKCVYSRGRTPHFVCQCTRKFRWPSWSLTWYNLMHSLALLSVMTLNTLASDTFQGQSPPPQSKSKTMYRTISCHVTQSSTVE